MKPIVIVMALTLLVFPFADADEKSLVLFVDSFDAKQEWTSASLAFDKLFYRTKGVKRKSIDLTDDQLKEIRKLSEKIKKALAGNPNPRGIPKGYAKEVINFSLTLPDSEKTFTALILEDDKEFWAEAIELRDYFDSIGIEAEIVTEK